MSRRSRVAVDYDFRPLKRFMREQKVTQNQIAKAVGVQSSVVSHMLTGRTILTHPVMWAIINATGMSCSEIEHYFFSERLRN